MCMSREQSLQQRECKRESNSPSSSPTEEKVKMWSKTPAEDPPSPLIAHEDATEKKMRMREFALIYVTYMAFLACRKNCAPRASAPARAHRRAIFSPRQLRQRETF